MADTPIGSEGPLNGVTAVTILAAPGAAAQRVIPGGVGAAVVNLDTVPHTIIFQKNKAATITVVDKIVGVEAGGKAILAKTVVLDATDESLEAKLGEAMVTTQPDYDVSAMQTT